MAIWKTTFVSEHLTGYLAENIDGIISSPYSLLTGWLQSCKSYGYFIIYLLII